VIDEGMREGEVAGLNPSSREARDFRVKIFLNFAIFCLIS
jgi:hypothetical protein